jgi:two-component system, NtrC family, response regulator AtoC
METILVAEDEPEVRNYLGLALNCQGYEVEFAQNGEEVLNFLEKDAAKVSLLLLDLIMPYKDGFETLQEVRRGWPGLPVITLSGSCTPANVASVMKAGALDFLSKPVAHEDLLSAIESALVTDKRDAPRNVCVREAYAAEPVSPAGTWTEKADLLVKRVAGSDVPVLLRGETGVGKEVLARKLHEHSKRAGRCFLKLNCAALPSELVESELFGYERGAFTGAFKNTPGKFEQAHGGTILLDEIGDMDFKLQAKLLQVLQDKEFLRLGAKDTQRVDVRVMAATHCDLEKAIVEGRFREDLYYRLNIIEVHVPPLRERKDEVLTLTRFFLDKYAPGESTEITPAFRQVLLDHDWPGNVRELENVVRKFLVFRSDDIIVGELQRRMQRRALAPVTANKPASLAQAASVVGTSGSAPAPMLPLEEDNWPQERVLLTAATSIPSSAPAPGRILEEVDYARKKAETEAILAALNATLWNRKQAAKLLDIDYKALLYKMKKLGIGEKPVEVAQD